MEIILGQFIKSLAESGLMTAVEVRAFLEGLPPEKKPDDGAGLARELVRRKRLTKFQAQAVYQGKTKGLILGDYVVLDRVGQGGMGQVYRAEHRTMRRVVALKTLPSAATKSQRAIQRFHREVRVAAKLVHPNIVTAYDAGESHGVHYLVMQYVAGSDLSSLVRKQGRLPVGTALDYVLQAARALEYAHSENVIHRDIKPSNILLDRQGTVKVLDMGLARLNEAVGALDPTAEETLTGTGQAMGTIDYMPPEQAENTKTVDERADIYSLGCTLFYLLTGRAVYSGDTTVTKLLAHREAAIPSLRADRPDVPEPLDAVFQRMVAKRPQDRYGSMTEVIAELQTCTAPRPEQLAETVDLGGPSPDAPQNNTLPVIHTEEPPAADSLPLDFPVISPVDTLLLRKQPGKDKKQQIILGAVAVGVMFILLLLGVIFLVRTPEGTAVVAVNEADADVDVLDELASKATSRKPSSESETGRPSSSPPPAVGPFDATTAKKHQEARADGLSTVSSVTLTPRATLTGFRGRISSLSFSADGTKLTSNGYGKGILVAWDVLKGEKIVSKRAHNEVVGCVTFADDGNLVAAGTYQRATIWRVDNGNMRHTYRGLPGMVTAVAFSPGSELLATGDSSGNLWLWDVAGETTRWRRSEVSCDSLKFSPDGTLLTAAGWKPPEFRLLDASTGEDIGSFVGHEGRVGAIDFSRDGRMIASGSDDKTLRLWDTATRQQWLALEHPAKVSSVSLSPGGGVAASGCEDHTVRMWSTRTGQLLATLADHAPPVAFAPVGDILATGGQGKTICLWDVRTTEAPSGVDAGQLKRESGQPSKEPDTLAPRAKQGQQPAPGGSGGLPAAAGTRADKPPMAPADAAAWTAILPAAAPPPAVAPFDAATAKKYQKAWADYLGVPVEFENSIGMKTMLIPPGEFLMGSTDEERARFLEEAKAAKDQYAVERIPSEGPQHRVRITRPFALGRHEVTRGQFRRFVEETGYKTEAERDGKGGWGYVDGNWVQDPRFVWSADPGFPQTDDHPVVNVSSNDATAFCQWASKKQGVKYGLPTEAQWEYACRAGTTTAWYCGDSDTTLAECAWFTANSVDETHPAGQLKPNAWGLDDMHGNVWEWCADWFGAEYYAQSLLNDPSGPTSDSLHVLRGGGWDYHAGYCRSAHRDNYPPDHRNFSLGFRPASVLAEE